MPANLYATYDELAEWIDDDPANLTDANGNSRQRMLEALIEAASRQADNDTGRVFYVQPATTRRYYANQVGMVNVVDLMASVVPTIAVDQAGDEVTFTPIAVGDYVLGPRIEQGGSLAAARYQWVRRNRTGAYPFVPFYAVNITGSWGYVDGDGRAPSGIRTAVLILASRLYMRRKAKLGRAVVLEAGLSEGLSTHDPDYMAAIEPFVHYSERFEMA